MKISHEKSTLKLYNSKELISLVNLGDDTAIQNFLKQGCNPNVTNDHGTTPALAAAQRNDIKILTLLIGAGAELNVKNMFGYTPLKYAELHKNSDMITLITSTLQQQAQQIKPNNKNTT